ncbi:hypothetical protein TNCV_4752871 [Trichonephila clavipes]|nr:hypothetical protein TNCV_4752871 [Trichonephila clavipes]
MFHMTTTPQERRHSRRMTNPATAECNMSGCKEDTSLWIAYFSSDRLDGPRLDTREISKIRTKKSAGVKSIYGTEEDHGYLQPANDSIFP